MQARKATLMIAVFGLAPVGCGSQDESSDTNRPPVLAIASPLALQQGRPSRVADPASDPDGDAIEWSFSAPAGVEAEVSDGMLVLYAGYDVQDTVELPVELRDSHGATTQATITLEVAAVRWQPRVQWTTEGPEAREHGAFLVDSEAQRVLLIGGSGYNPYLTPLFDVWELDLSSDTWTELSVPGGAPSGGSRRAAPIPGTRTAYLFGGYGLNGASNADLYRVDFSTPVPSIELVDQQGAPAPRALHAFVYDPEVDAFFLFGGSGSSVFGDTWRMRLEGGSAVWTQLSPAESPSPRYGFFYGFDAANGRLLVFSGAQSGGATLDPASDTWALDTRAQPPTWTRVNDGSGAPPGRRNGCFVIDPLGPRLFVFGGTADAQTTEPGLFAFDARPGHEAWAELTRPDAPTVRSSGFGFYDPLADRIVCGFGNTSSTAFRDLTPIGY